MSAGARLRLGRVTSNTRERFTLPRAHQWAPDLRLLTDPVGSRSTHESEPIVAVPGQVVRWTVNEVRSFRAPVIR